MLIWDPNSRITADQILQHSYLSELHDDSDEPSADFLFDWNLIELELDLENWKVLIENVFQFYFYFRKSKTSSLEI